MNLIDDLNDNCFALATEYIAHLAREVHEETGTKPSLSELCDLLAWGFRSCSADILRDVDPNSVTSVTAKVSSRRKANLVPGDILAVPGADRRVFLIGVFRVSCEWFSPVGAA